MSFSIVGHLQVRAVDGHLQVRNQGGVRCLVPIVVTTIDAYLFAIAANVGCLGFVRKFEGAGIGIVSILLVSKDTPIDTEPVVGTTGKPIKVGSIYGAELIGLCGIRINRIDSAVLTAEPCSIMVNSVIAVTTEAVVDNDITFI